jgi:hypothetical protein
MSKPNWEDKENSATREDNPKRSFLRADHCGPNLLFVPDADDLNTFLNYAAKFWRLAHPVKRGRPREDQLIFETYIQMNGTG